MKKEGKGRGKKGEKREERKNNWKEGSNVSNV